MDTINNGPGIINNGFTHLVTIVQTRPETVHSNNDDNSVSDKWDPVAYATKYAFKS